MSPLRAPELEASRGVAHQGGHTTTHFLSVKWWKPFLAQHGQKSCMFLDIDSGNSRIQAGKKNSSTSTGSSRNSCMGRSPVRMILLIFHMDWGAAKKQKKKNSTSPFSRRFREGISFPNFVERSTRETASLQALCFAPRSADQHWSRGREGRKGAERRGRGVASKCVKSLKNKSDY